MMGSGEGDGKGKTGKRQRAMMIECCQSLRRVVRMIHPSSHPRFRAPFRFLARRSSRQRSRVAVCARSHSWHRRLVGLWLFSPRVSHCLRRPDIVHPCLAIIASAHWHFLGRLLSLSRPIIFRRANRIATALCCERQSRNVLRLGSRNGRYRLMGSIKDESHF